jgi:DNA-binding LytR/AlgR family response regulator
MTIIAAEDIECVIAEGNYLHMMTQKRKFFVRGVLSDVERMLPSPDFLRVHRSGRLFGGA